MSSLKNCRVCENTELVPVLDLGVQAYTGFFPKNATEAVPTGPLRLVKCHGKEACGLVQLADSFSLPELYGEQYGYRSGLNASMVRHLEQKVAAITRLQPLHPEDIIVDVGSNDGTTWGFIRTLPSFWY